MNQFSAAGSRRDPSVAATVTRRDAASEQNPVFHSNLATPRHGPASLPAIIVEIFYYYGVVQIWLMIGLAIAFIVFEKLRRQESTGSVMPLVVSSAGVLLPTFTLYWLSGTQDPRRAMVGITLMLVTLMTAVLRRTGPLAKVGFAVIAAMALGQVYLLAMTEKQLDQPARSAEILQRVIAQTREVLLQGV